MHAQHPVASGTSPAAPAGAGTRVEPWGLGSRFGQWYLVGLDRARGDKRLLPALPPDLRRDRPGAGRSSRRRPVQRPAELAEPPELPVRPPWSTSSRAAAGIAQACRAGPLQPPRGRPRTSGTRSRGRAGATDSPCPTGTPRCSARSSPPTGPASSWWRLPSFRRRPAPPGRRREFAAARAPA